MDSDGSDAEPAGNNVIKRNNFIILYIVKRHNPCIFVQYTGHAFCCFAAA